MAKEAHSAFKTLRILIRLIGAGPMSHTWIALVNLVKTLPVLLAPVFLSELVRIARHNESEDQTWLITLCIGFAVLILMNVPVHVYFIHLTSRLTRRMEYDLRTRLIQCMQRLSMGFHTATPSGSLQAKVLRDVDSLVQLVTVLFAVCLPSLVGGIWSLSFAFISNPLVGIAFVVATPPAVLLLRGFRAPLKETNKRYRQRMEHMASRLSEMIDLIPMTRAHGNESTEERVAEGHLQHVQHEGHSLDKTTALFQSSSWACMQMLLCSVASLSAVLAWMGHMSVEHIILYHGLFALVVGHFTQFMMFLPQLARGVDAIESMDEVLSSPEVEENEGKMHLEDVRGALAFKQVKFSYPDGQTALHNFSLSVEPGECVAFVGPSGSGKSTLLNLLIGFWRTQGGSIHLEGIDQENIDMRSWRKHVAVVPQTTVLVSGSVRDNVCYGMEGLSDDDVWSALQVADLAETIDAWPNKLETEIGSNGVKLSGGQRQRLAIARAVIRDPKVIILDEATSALDVFSENAIQESIDRLTTGRTTLIVAHRLSTIKKASRVVVMKDGCCVESGTRAELLAQQGIFYDMHKMQA